MSLPKAVLEAERRADAIHARVYAPEGTPTQSPQTPPTAPTVTPAPAVSTTPPPTPAPAKVDTEETWEARYKTLAGKYNAEIPRLRQENDALKSDLNTARTQLDGLTKRIETLEKEKTTAPLVRPEEVESFGEPLTDFVRRVSREEATRVVPVPTVDVTKLEGEIAEIKETTAKERHNAFIARLTELVPDWQTINVDPTFHAFLAEIDPLFGQERQAGLSAAQAAYDATRAARFFDTFKATLTTRATAAPDKLTPQVVPDTRAPAVPPGGKKLFTRAEVEKFYADWRAGRISDADAVVMEAEINLAMSERRIR